MSATPRPDGTPKRVLLAEDDPLQRRLAERLLEVRGHQVTAVAGGEEALSCFVPGRFDLVLLDLEMTTLGGLDTAAAIRRREAGGGPRSRVVALTAHPAERVAARCADAGMDGCVTKPLAAETLDRLLEEGSPGPPATQPGAGAGIDWASALDAVAGNHDLLRELSGVARVEAPRQLELARRAVDRGDAEAARRAAHTLQGALRIFGSTPAAALAHRVERLAGGGELEAAAGALAELVPALERHCSELALGPPPQSGRSPLHPPAKGEPCPES